MIGRRGLLGHLGAAMLLTMSRHRTLAQDTNPAAAASLGDPLASEIGAAYAALVSYSDRGTVTTTYQWPGSEALIETHQFRTSFRAPRNFFFRFTADPASGGDEYVVWCDGGAFQSWWKATNTHEILDGGRGATAFLNGSFPTKDAVNLISPHLFPQVNLPGPTSRLIGLREEGEEEVNGLPCTRLAATGRETGVATIEERPITIWIDREARLVRQVLLAEHSGSPGGLIDRTSFQIEPVADPELPDASFTFRIPT